MKTKPILGLGIKNYVARRVRFVFKYKNLYIHVYTYIYAYTQTHAHTETRRQEIISFYVYVVESSTYRRIYFPFKIIILCMCFASMYVCVSFALLVPKEARESIRSSGTGTIDSYEYWSWTWVL